MYLNLKESCSNLMIVVEIDSVAFAVFADFAVFAVFAVFSVRCMTFHGFCGIAVCNTTNNRVF